MSAILDRLREGLDLSVGGSVGSRQSSIAYSRGGSESYLAGGVVSQTKLLHVPSEQAALLLAVQRLDYEISDIVTLQESPDYNAPLLPSTVMVMVDFMRRTGRNVGLTILDSDEQTIVKTRDIRELAPYYSPDPIVQGRYLNSTPDPAEFDIEKGEEKDSDVVRQLALMGLERAFTTHDEATKYGAVAISDDGRAFISGQYSSFDGRTNIHAETASVLNGAMRHAERIVSLGLVSTKFVERPAAVCGCCRQFLREFAELTGCEPKIYTFGTDTDKHDEHSLDEYLPDSWSSNG